MLEKNILKKLKMDHPNVHFVIFSHVHVHVSLGVAKIRAEVESWPFIFRHVFFHAFLECNRVRIVKKLRV